MGNNQANPSSSRMAISAMAEHMKITKAQLLTLRDACLTYTVTGEGGEPTLSTISRRDFHKAMSEAGVPKSDQEILDGLFTMWDKVGDDRADTMMFVTGISPLASVLDIKTKLRFAFEVYDIDRSGELTPGDMESVFAAINATTSYVGDPVMTSQQIEIVVEDVFKSPTSAMTKDTIVFADSIDEIASHPIILEFSSGGGAMRYGSK